MGNKKVVRLTESQLRNMIAESVKKVLREAKTLEEDGVFDIYRHRYGGPAFLAWGFNIFEIPENYPLPNLYTNQGRNEMLAMIKNGEFKKINGDFSTLLTRLGEKGYREESFNANAY